MNKLKTIIHMYGIRILEPNHSNKICVMKSTKCILKKQYSKVNVNSWLASIYKTSLGPDVC